ncbi:MAG TPA: sigma 54-interacting transcriptional regulator [Bryobacteraceae bacterium]|jgi:Nif-specific regulatory protein
MPKLVSIVGPLCGGVFALPESEAETFSIGRSVNNTLCIPDPSVSRNHCVLARRASEIVITDSGSVNRTYINGMPLVEHTLRNGDEIQLGESLFLFVTEVEPGTPESETATLAGNIHSASTQMLRVPESIHVSGALGKYFDALLAVGEVIPSGARLEDVAGRILESLCCALPAERGVLIVGGASPGEPDCVREWRKEQGSDGVSVPAAALLDIMTREPAPVLWRRATAPASANPPGMTVGPEVSSLLAVPLLAFGRFIGALCFATADPKTGFEEDHLRFLRKAAGLAAALLDAAFSARNRESEFRQRSAVAHLEHNMVGESPRMRRVYDTIAKVAPTDSTVLIRGESGTGKELAASALHRNSLRAGKPFVAINCAAITETLLESELFGHERGAFTGAVAQKKGKLEEAHGGTVFFDEVSEMSPTLQAKLLRVLQEREFERVGGTRPIRTDVRVVTATNRDLEDSIRRGAFRADLYYRLNVVSLFLPPLRERREDIAPLANHFVRKHSRKLKKWITGISPQALALLRAYDWPGNVRELENTIERALVLGSTDRIQPEDLPESVIEAGGSPAISAGSFNDSITEAKKRLILETLQRANGNHAEAARLLDLHPNSLHRMIRNLNLKPKPDA